MKKFLLPWIIGLLLLSLAGCSLTNDDKQNTTVMEQQISWFNVQIQELKKNNKQLNEENKRLRGDSQWISKLEDENNELKKNSRII